MRLTEQNVKNARRRMRVNYYGQELRTNIQICMNIQRRRRRGLCNILLYDTRTFCVRLYVERKKEKRKEGITENNMLLLLDMKTNHKIWDIRIWDTQVLKI